MGDEKVKKEAMEMMGLFQILPRLVVFDLDYTLWPFYWKQSVLQARARRLLTCRRPYRIADGGEMMWSITVAFQLVVVHRAIDKEAKPAKVLTSANVFVVVVEFYNCNFSQCLAGNWDAYQSECRSKREMPKLYPDAKGILLALKEKGVDVAIASRSPTADIAKTFLDKLDLTPMFVAQEIYSSWTHKTEHFERIHRRTGVPFNSMLFYDDEDRNIVAVSKMGVTSILVDDGVNLGAFKQGLEEFSQNFGSSDRNKQKK